MKFVRPTLVLNESVCKSNIASVYNKLKYNSFFRPHFKTHQSLEIGSWYKELGVTKITVSSVSMAKYFTKGDWQDIFIAIPVNILEIGEINKLANYVTLHLAVDSLESIQFLAENLKSEVGVYIKIDTGYHRTGIEISRLEEMDQIIAIFNKSMNLTFSGFFTHSGNTYKERDKNSIEKIYQNSLEALNFLKSKYILDFPDIIISVGDTPSCSILSEFGDVDEIRPGNFVFYDLMQYYLGSCDVMDIAVAVACPIVSKNKERSEIVIYGGAVHLSKEYVINEEGNVVFGLVCKLNNGGWSNPLENTYLSSLSQEHGIIKISENHFNTLSIGDVVGILPVHSCLTANLFSEYRLINGRKFSKFRSL